MIRIAVSILCTFFLSTGFSQEQEIRSTIDKFFQSMYKRDTMDLRSYFIPAAKLMTYSYDSKGNPRSRAETLNDLIRGVSLIGEGELEERLLSWQCLVDDGIASVWTPYAFYFNGEFSHCGVNSFQLMKVQGVWKITLITDTRRKTDCPDNERAVMQIDSFINAWHHAASVADEVAFFGSMTEDGVYIGTDSSERWKRDELALWSKKYFDRESAWSFTPLSRTVTIGPGGQIAWFDELLDTWMGPCRSTGIVVLKDNLWKIVHYQLSVAMPNDKIDEYKKLIDKK